MSSTCTVKINSVTVNTRKTTVVWNLFTLRLFKYHFKLTNEKIFEINCNFQFGIHQVFWDTCSWQGQVGQNEKLESFKLESPRLERVERSWKNASKIGNFLLKLESLTEVGKFK